MIDKERMMAMYKYALRAVLIATAIFVSGCGESETKTSAPKKPVAAPVAQFSVGGPVSGLAGSGLTLQLNGANDLIVIGNGPYKFPKALSKGSTYTVTIKASPVAPVKQVCSVSQGSGRIVAAVNNVAVSCVTQTFAVGGKVSGLTGKGLVVQLNGESDLAIAKNGNFVFPDIRLPDGSDYRVVIKAYPSRQNCTIKSINYAPDEDTLDIVEINCAKIGRSK